MAKTIYNKLIRDRIPEIIKADNAECDLCVLSKKEFLEALLAKIQEEAAEISQAKGKEEFVKELADLKEVLKALQSELNITDEEVETVRQDRAVKRGAFTKKLLLISTSKGDK